MFRAHRLGVISKLGYVLPKINYLAPQFLQHSIRHSACVHLLVARNGTMANRNYRTIVSTTIDWAVVLTAIAETTERPMRD